MNPANLIQAPLRLGLCPCSSTCPCARRRCRLRRLRVAHAAMTASLQALGLENRPAIRGSKTVQHAATQAEVRRSSPPRKPRSAARCLPSPTRVGPSCRRVVGPGAQSDVEVGEDRDWGCESGPVSARGSHGIVACLRASPCTRRVRGEYAPRSGHHMPDSTCATSRHARGRAAASTAVRSTASPPSSCMPTVNDAQCAATACGNTSVAVLSARNWRLRACQHGAGDWSACGETARAPIRTEAEGPTTTGDWGSCPDAPSSR